MDRDPAAIIAAAQEAGVTIDAPVMVIEAREELGTYVLVLYNGKRVEWSPAQDAGVEETLPLQRNPRPGIHAGARASPSVSFCILLGNPPRPAGAGGCLFIQMKKEPRLGPSLLFAYRVKAAYGAKSTTGISSVPARIASSFSFKSALTSSGILSAFSWKSDSTAPSSRPTS